MATKYLKNNEGLVRAVTTDSLQLEKPLTNENYDVNVFNRNMDKVDAAIQEVKGKVDGLELTAQRVSIADTTNKFEATNVEDALLENKTSIQTSNNNISKLQSNVTTMQGNISSLQTNVSTIQSNISSLQSEINGQRLKAIQINNELEDIL